MAIYKIHEEKSYSDLLKALAMAGNKIFYLKQALDEIEEVCKKDMKDKDRYDKMFGCYIAKTILQIIQKVKEQ